MISREALQEVLWWTVMFICLVFFIFAAWVTIAERLEVPEEVPSPTVTVSEPKMGQPKTTEKPVNKGAMPDPMIEDTYLVEGHPLSLENQMLLYGACLEFQVDYDLALAVIEQETRYQNISGDSGDSEGFMQIQRKWWKGLMAEIGAADLMNPEDNFRTGCAILRQLLDKYGNTEDALTAYNSGKPGQSKYSREVLARCGA